MRRTPKDTEESARIIGRRGLILGGAQLAFVGILAARMRYMQVEQADEFRLLADENRINIRLIPPARGLIFDRNGITLAENEQNYRVVLVREDAGDVDQVLARLAQIITLTPEDLEKTRREIARLSPFVPVTVADRLTWEEFAEVSVNAPALPGVTPEVGLSRIYPLDTDFAHIVGYVGPVSDYDLGRLEDPDPLLQIPKFQIGKTGVESKMEADLRGKAGTRRIEVNAVGRVMRELDRVEGRPGDNLQLTVDSALQNYVQARLGEESAVRRGHGHPDRGYPGHRVGAVVRSQQVRARHYRSRLRRVDGKRIPPAGQQDGAGAVSTGLDLQDGDRAGRA